MHCLQSLTPAQSPQEAAVASEQLSAEQNQSLLEGREARARLHTLFKDPGTFDKRLAVRGPASVRAPTDIRAPLVTRPSSLADWESRQLPAILNKSVLASDHLSETAMGDAY